MDKTFLFITTPQNYTFKYFFIDRTLPRTPIPIPKTRYTSNTDWNISENCNILKLKLDTSMLLADLYIR